ncbi:MAG: FHA domain-containing protein [Verrucomicrobiota bacterium]
MPRVIITVPEKTAQPYRFQLDHQSVTLGRGSDNDIAIDSGSVSVKHAEMRRVGGGYVLRDLGSTNGLKLGDQRGEEIPLYHGISLKLGDVAFDFTLTEEEREALAQETRSGAAAGIWEADKSTSRLPPLRDEPPRQVAMLEPAEPEAKSGGPTLILLIILLALAAFGIGMAIRFQKDTGGPLIDAIKAKRPPQSTPANTAPALHP